MSFARLVYYSAVIGGWSAFVGWLFGESLFAGGAGGTIVAVAGIGALVGAAIGSGLNLVAGSTNLHWKQLLVRLVPGIVVGGVVGALGIVVGNFLYVWVGLPRVFGWLVIGLGIGTVEGITDRSPQKLRNGLIGGGLGGLLGGILFDVVGGLVQLGSGMTSRATSFVVLGVCIGLFIGLTQVILKRAWLTVVDGYRPGRQLILSKSVTFLGRGDHLALPFMGPNNLSLEGEHLKIIRLPAGSYQVEDNNTKLGSFLNNKPLQTAMGLEDGDVIKFGGNFVRFNFKKAGSSPSQTTPSTTTSATGNPAIAARIVPPPPPPPPKKQTAVATLAPPPVNVPISIQPATPPRPAVQPPSVATPPKGPPPAPPAPPVGGRPKLPPPPPPPKKRV